MNWKYRRARAGDTNRAQEGEYRSMTSPKMGVPRTTQRALRVAHIQPPTAQTRLPPYRIPPNARLIIWIQRAVKLGTTANWLSSGRTPGRLGSAHPNIAPYDKFAAGDGELFLGVVNDGQFRRFCRQVKREDLLEDPRFAKNIEGVGVFALGQRFPFIPGRWHQRQGCLTPNADVKSS